MSAIGASDPLAALSAAGVSVWLDDLSRELLAGGELKKLIADRHVVGVTTNPTIFASALSEGDRYNEQLRALSGKGASVDDAVFALTTDDVREGCDVLAPVHERTGGVDGRVSIEVDPGSARDADVTIDQAGRLWETIDRPNLFVKIPATREGLAAITAVIARGISVNVTLIFSLDRYGDVMDAYQAGLEQAQAAGHDLSGIHSVASFFVSRVDTETDRRLDEIGTPEARNLKGRAAVANARLAYRAYEHMVAEPRWRRLAAAGANVQRPLWASTGVKNPDYPDTMYVSELAIPGTVNTMPGATLAAFADHGTPPASAEPSAAHYAAAEAHLASLQAVGIDFADVTDALEREGLEKFEASWAQLAASVGEAMRSGAGPAAGAADGGSDSADLLAIYLNDHYTGATGGLELFRRAAGAATEKEKEAVLTDLARQVEEDRDALAQIMSDLGVSVDRARAALGWVAEKAGRLKTNGHLFSRSPLSEVLEAEAMLLGVLGKAACWRTLRARADTDRRLDAAKLDTLLERAERQSTALEELRTAAAARALDARTAPGS
ncbi:transaldolase [Actinacidiphila sp. DG2A-62]|uniref:transaldolase n=1 Tax=Actinacidiphila sp. DG2A-62 TaxID=3108821 RepID=UPI002DBC7D5F|nr:transaldolase [Actinacidiphila sp. DG2A-62]MEC3992954.1 transaldolase [Actinacidiphila sp. DG2A-62]